MSELFLDLRNQPRVVDFLVEAMEYAPAKDRVAAEKLVAKYQEAGHVPTGKLAEEARELAMASFPARFALKRFFSTDGAEEEWKLVNAAIRPSTAHLLQRVRKSSGVSTLDEVLEHADADSALKEEERHEIDEVRSQIRIDYWKSHIKTFAVLVKEGEEELKALRERFEKLRELAAAFPEGMEDEVFSKVEYYEDRILFALETVPQSTLDEEIAYYVEQKVESPFDEEVN